MLISFTDWNNMTWGY